MNEYNVVIPQLALRVLQARTDLRASGVYNTDNVSLVIHQIMADDLILELMSGPNYPIVGSGDKIFGFNVVIDNKMDPRDILLRLEVKA